MTLHDDALMEWLRVQMLRLRSLDWGPGSRSIHWLKDGVAKFGAHYSIETLCSHLNVSEDQILEFIDSAPALCEMEGKSFTASWTGGGLSLSWLEEGIRELKTDISQDYFEKDGAYFRTFRWINRAIYLDGYERIITDTGLMGPAEVSEEEFIAVRQKLDNQTSQ